MPLTADSCLATEFWRPAVKRSFQRLNWLCLPLGVVHKSVFCKRGSVNVRFAPKADKRADVLGCPLCAISGLMHRSKDRRYSITSSAVICMISGIVRPSALAVLRLMINSNLVGACTGRSPGLSPFRMRST
jgi:hypothetical protein